MRIMATTPVSYYQNHQRTTASKQQAFGQGSESLLELAWNAVKKSKNFTYERIPGSIKKVVFNSDNLKIEATYGKIDSRQVMTTIRVSGDGEYKFASRTPKNSSIFEDIDGYLFSHSCNKL